MLEKQGFFWYGGCSSGQMIATTSYIPYKCPAGVGFLFTVLVSQWLGKAMPPSSSHLVASVSTQRTVFIPLHSHSNPGCNGCWEPPGPDWQLKVPCPSPEDIKQTTTSVRCGNKCPGPWKQATMITPWQGPKWSKKSPQWCTGYM